MALDATVEGAAANSYATVAEYKAYWGDRPQSTIPLGFTDAEIETGLEFGCVLLTACFNWNGTATTSDGDYVAKTGTLTFAPGETTKTITIEVKGDSKKEAHKTFYLDLFGNSSNSLFTKNRGLGTILNDD